MKDGPDDEDSYWVTRLIIIILFSFLLFFLIVSMDLFVN